MSRRASGAILVNCQHPFVHHRSTHVLLKSASWDQYILLPDSLSFWVSKKPPGYFHSYAFHPICCILQLQVSDADNFKTPIYFCMPMTFSLRIPFLELKWRLAAILMSRVAAYRGTSFTYKDSSTNSNNNVEELIWTTQLLSQKKERNSGRVGTTYTTSLSSMSDGKMVFTATGVPRQWVIRISPNEPYATRQICPS